MNITGKHSADIVGFHIKRNKTHDGREAFVDFDIGVKQDEAESRFGESFKALAFATLQVVEAQDEDDGDSFAFLVDSIKPGQRVVYETHRIGLEGEVFEAQPELRSIRTVDGEARVVAKFRLPIDVGRTALIASLASKVGQTVKVDFDPKQASFGFTPRVVADKPASTETDGPDEDDADDAEAGEAHA